jgi:hypothetical protein
MALFHRFKSDLDKMCMVNALNLKESDLQFIGKLNEITNNLEASVWELEDFGKEASGAEQALETKVEEIEQAEEVKKEAGSKKEKREQKEKENNKAEVA